MFRWLGTIYYYVVSHFGAKFAGYWWKRFGAFLHRVTHKWIRVPHAAWVYEDDSLCKLVRCVAPLRATQILLLWEALGVPISWRKVFLDEQVDWVGFNVDLSARSVALPQDKRERIIAWLLKLLSTPQNAWRAEVQSIAGFLSWASAAYPLAKPFLMDFHAAAHHPGVAMIRMSREDLDTVIPCLGTSGLTLEKQPPGSRARPGWTLAQVASVAVSSLSDVQS